MQLFVPHGSYKCCDWWLEPAVYLKPGRQQIGYSGKYGGGQVYNLVSGTG
jgi:hypothetical protein